MVSERKHAKVIDHTMQELPEAHHLCRCLPEHYRLGPELPALTGRLPYLGDIKSPVRRVLLWCIGREIFG
jgi:hypothetical protein